jgi:hypothetical protein
VTVTNTWLRLEVRRRWRSLAVLALLVAFAAGTVLTALAGARRGSTTIDRMLERTLPLTAVVLPNQPGFDWAKIRALPQVAAIALFPVSGFGVDGIPLTDNVSAFPTDGDDVLRTIERPIILEGRLPDPSRVDEVVVTPRFPVSYHKGVGARINLRLMSPDQAATFDPASGDSLRGPAIPATIVGVVRSPWFSEGVGDKGQVISTPALFAKYRANFIAPGEGYINALVRLKGGRAAIPAFRTALAKASGRVDIDVWDFDTKFTTPARRLDDFEAASLLAFGLAGLAAAIVLVGQSVVRYATTTTADLLVLRSVGMSPRQAMAAASAGPFLAALAGTTLGIAGAVVASAWMPIGAAALHEPSPGIDVDWLVLGTGWALVPALILVSCMAVAGLALAKNRREPSGRRSAVALAAARAGLPVPMVIGARFALEPGRGPSAVPVRPALLGAVAGVLGVLAAFTFSEGVLDAARHPERFGQTHQLEVFFGLNGQDYGPAPPVLQAVARDPAVQAVNDARISVAESGKTTVTTYTYAPINRPLPIVLLDGRVPKAANEIVLAPSSASALNAGVGDTVPMRGVGGKASSMKVTGIAFLPEGSHNGYADGAWITPAGHDTLFAGAHYAFKFHVAEVALRPGTDLAAARQRMQRDIRTIKGAEGFSFSPPTEVAQVRQVRDVEELPILLAGFLALLALGAVGHAVATAVRRRRHEMAVLRALGMTRWQARLAVITQATMLAVVGLGFGVPLGVALGRTLWRVVADITPVAYVPPLALWALLLICPLTLVLANLLAVWPGHVATRLRVGHILRTE